MSQIFRTPVALIIFNRPDSTKRVFEAIRRIKPPKLFVIADGPRADRPDDKEKCAETRLIIDSIDWDCEVFKNYSDINLGCGVRPATGITWVFEQVEEAIILEDDCLPHPSFFDFCQELLEKYRYDERIMHISGDNFQFGRRQEKYSYYFSRYNHIWGWATWRRSWANYDYDMKLWPEIKKTGFLENIFEKKSYSLFWQTTFDNAYKDFNKNYWDYQWTFACWIQNGLSIIPNVNLVSNIGFNSAATHTKDNESQFANIPTEGMLFPLEHPLYVIRDTERDNLTQSNNFGYIQSILVHKIKGKIKKMIRK